MFDKYFDKFQQGIRLFISENQRQKHHKVEKIAERKINL